MEMTFKQLGIVAYQPTIDAMEAHVNAMKAGESDEAIWFLEHPSLYTAGTSAQASDLLDPQFPVHKTGRGGEYTYHGPGQLVAYVMLNLKKRQSEPDIKRYVWCLEEWIIQTLRDFDIAGERREGRVGIWVVMPDGRESKIAAIGVRVRHWITFHGIAINLNPDLSHYKGIVPCGIANHGVTSLEEQRASCTMDQLTARLKDNYRSVFF